MFKNDAVCNSTFDYDSFKLLKNNRVIKVKKTLRDEIIKTSGNVSPIVVDRQGYIYDGQHRWLVCKEEGLPLTYVVEDRSRLSKVSPKVLNASMTNWKTKDYIACGIKDDNVNYIRLGALVVANKLNAAAVYYAIFNRHFRQSKDLMDDTLTITREQYNQYAAAFKKINEVLEILDTEKDKKYRQMLSRNRMWYGLCKLAIKNPNFNINKMAVLLKEKQSDIMILKKVQESIDYIENYINS